MKTIQLFAAFMGIVLLASCYAKKQDKTITKEKDSYTLSDTMAHMIKIDAVQLCDVNEELELSGEVSYDENKVVKIYPRSSGQVLQSPFSLGDKVEAGQVLAVIKSADVAGNYADVSSAEADIAIAKRQMENGEALYKNGIASEREYEVAKEDYRKALAERQKINAQIQINGGSGATASGTYTLTAPTSGYIVEKKVNGGDFIRPDMGDNLFTISDLKDVWVWANVYEADIAKVREGTDVQVKTLAYPDKIYPGKIDKISQVLDPNNKALKVRIRLDNADMMLKPQMFATVVVTNPLNEQALCVSTKALIQQNGKTYVVVYNNDHDMKIAEVNVLKTVGDKTYLNSGLAPGQKVITQNEIFIFQQLAGD
ncbi:efflux RND transporter periplasmic adaptor subunit [Ilyomonas limi]|uniref:Efflux RND transporter periplasmic adaptor subunit n=1 Tax=Ilyomonas limi TaxID=2575867 RepID=A0A4U3KVZ0_9BACT|nr:efflux RND transporter periplasmic adaptor subunit [Ilyomonas limi]TKK66711.1 efflux RND transporter periplasmic adaptor subunit [Ilyomonas limi]